MLVVVYENEKLKQSLRFARMGLFYDKHMKLGNRHTRGSARTTNARGRSTRGLTYEPVPIFLENSDKY